MNTSEPSRRKAPSPEPHPRLLLSRIVLRRCCRRSTPCRGAVESGRGVRGEGWRGERSEDGNGGGGGDALMGQVGLEGVPRGGRGGCSCPGGLGWDGLGWAGLEIRLADRKLRQGIEQEQRCCCVQTKTRHSGRMRFVLSERAFCY